MEIMFYEQTQISLHIKLLFFKHPSLFTTHCMLCNAVLYQDQTTQNSVYSPTWKMQGVSWVCK